MLCVCQCTSAARFPLGQSVAAAEHPGLAQPSIRRRPRLSAYRHTQRNAHTHTHKCGKSLACVLEPSDRRMPRPPTTLLKGYSCCVRVRRANGKKQTKKKIKFLSQDSTQTTSNAASSFSHFRLLSSSADGNLGDINPHTFTGHEFFRIGSLVVMSFKETRAESMILRPVTIK